jgi:hypothetical protein
LGFPGFNRRHFPAFVHIGAYRRTNPDAACANTNVPGFVKGAYGAAIGAILGACALLGRLAIGDWLTALIGLASLAVLFRRKVGNPMLIAASAVVGLIAFPLLQPGLSFWTPSSGDASQDLHTSEDADKIGSAVASLPGPRGGDAIGSL